MKRVFNSLPIHLKKRKDQTSPKDRKKKGKGTKKRGIRLYGGNRGKKKGLIRIRTVTIKINEKTARN